MVNLLTVMRWCWPLLALSVGLMLVSIPRQRLQKFFQQVELRGADGKLPRCVKVKKVSRYLKKVTFKSRVTLPQWEKVRRDLEQFFRQRIYSIEQHRKDVRKVDIYLVQEELPSLIPWNDKYMVKGRKFAVGEGYKGPVNWDATTLPHGLVAGATGGGKTVLLRCIIHQAIQKKFNVTVLDFKGGGDYASVEREAAKYRDLEGGYGPIFLSDPVEADKLLTALNVEVKGRAEEFKKRDVANIDDYNALGGHQFVPWLLVIDEAAEILDVKPTEKAEKELYTRINQSLHTLARTSRAAGVHILMGFIRPDANVLDGQIKNNLLWRVCGYFADPAASRIALDNDKATGLPPEVKGRFIIGEDEAQAYYLPSTVEHGKRPAAGDSGSEADAGPSGAEGASITPSATSVTCSENPGVGVSDYAEGQPEPEMAVDPEQSPEQRPDP